MVRGKQQAFQTQHKLELSQEKIKLVIQRNWNFMYILLTIYLLLGRTPRFHHWEGKLPRQQLTVTSK